MLFNSYEFLLGFLPAAIAGFYLAARRDRRAARIWLVLASLFFYAWWNATYLALLVGSILVNFRVGRTLGDRSGDPANRNVALLTLGIVANVALLGYFKYATFAVENANRLFGTDYGIDAIVLPLAISFFTFQQIGYLVDSYRGGTQRYGFFDYAAFVTFFPQLIAGPIVRHGELLPQLTSERFARFDREAFALGLTVFSFGLFQKAVLADGVAQYATPVFDAAAAGTTLTIAEAWFGATAYTLQLYFDFAGYSTMAVGLGLLFGLRLPQNFYSPYRATSIIEFWRRWHISLTRFITAYIFTPIAMPLQRYCVKHGFGGLAAFVLTLAMPMMITFLVSGLWHGAGWTFVMFGGLHGAYLVVNHAWRRLRRGGRSGSSQAWWREAIARIATFLAVMISFVYFRAADIETAHSVLRSMIGSNGLSLPDYLATTSAGGWLASHGATFRGLFVHGLADFRGGFVWLVLVGLVAWLGPNIHELTVAHAPALKTYPGKIVSWGGARCQWRLSPSWGIAVGLLLALSILGLGRASEFLYFQF